MTERGRWEGMRRIARFNWPLYAIAAAVFIVAMLGLWWTSGFLGKAIWGAIAAGCVWFLLGSLGASHWVYDRSDLYRWGWLSRALGELRPQTVIFCHAGFDEASEALRSRLAPAHWQVLDHYDAQRMTEPSIHRARRLFPPTAETIAAPGDRWPVAGGKAEVVFGLLAIHEFTRHEERVAWFAEARRALQPGGRVILVEHLRDLANFVAFGPGFLHFHSAATWRRAWEEAGLRQTDTFSITPFVRVFVLISP